MDIAAEKKFQALKRRLDQFHYSLPLNIESAPLVERLFNDLIKTAEGFQSLKKIHEESKNQINKQDLLLAPLKKENERIVKENNELHHDIIKCKEEYQSKENQWRASIKAIEDERSDLRFVITQKDARLKQLELDNIALKEKIENTLNKIYISNQNNLLPNFPKNQIISDSNIVPKVQGMKMTHPLMPSNAQNIENEGNQRKELWAEELKKADERVSKFQEQYSKCENLRKELSEKLLNMETIVDARDKEIARLQRLYEGGQNLDKLSMKYINDNNEQTLQKLNNHIDFLNKENHKLMQEIKLYKSSGMPKSIQEKSEADINFNEKLKQTNESYLLEIAELKSGLEMIQKSNKAKVEELMKHKEIELQKKDQDIEELNSRINNLISELSLIKNDNNSIVNIKSAYNSDKKAFNDAIEKFKIENGNLKNQINSLNIQIRQVQQDSNSLIVEINNLKFKNESLQKELESSINNNERLNSEIEYKNEETINLRNRISELENVQLNSTNVQANYKFESDKLMKSRQGLEDQLNQARNENVKCKSLLEIANNNLNKLESQLNSVKKENDFLKKDFENSNIINSKNRLEKVDLEKKCSEYFAQLTAAVENNQILQNEHKLLSEELTELNSKLHKIETSKGQLQVEVGEYRVLKENYNKALNENQSKTVSISKLENEKVILQNKISSLETQNNEFKQLDENQNIKLKGINNEKEQLIEKIKSLEFDVLRYSQDSRIINSSKQNIEIQKEAIENVEKKNRELLIEMEDLKARDKKNIFEIEKLNQRIQSLLSQKKALEDEYRTKQNEYENLLSILNKDKTKTITQDQALLHSEMEINDLKKAILNERVQKDNMDQEKKRLLKRIDEEKEKVLVLNSQVEKLKILVTNLDQSKEELLDKIKALSVSKKEEEVDKKSLFAKIEQLEKESYAKNEEITSYKNIIEKLDLNLDKLQNSLDEKTILASKLDTELSSCKNELAKHSNLNVEFSSKEENYIKILEEKDKEIESLQTNLNKIDQEHNSLKEQFYSKTKEEEDLIHDVEVLTQENQIVNNELAKYQQAIKEFEVKMVDQEKKYKEIMQNLRAVQLEKDDILQTYKSLLVENERIMKAQKIHEKENKELMIRLQEKEKEIMNMGIILSKAQETEEKLVAENGNLERDITIISNELKNYHNAIKEGELEKQQLLNNIQNAQNLSFTLENKHEELQRNISRLENDKNNLLYSLKESSEKIEGLKANAEDQKVQYSQLELVLQKERTKQQENHILIQTLEKERSDMALENSRLIQRISLTSSELKSKLHSEEKITK